MLFPTYSSVPFVKVLHIFQLCFVNIFLELLRTKQQKTPQQVVNGRLINYNVMYATVRCDKKNGENRHAMRTSRCSHFLRACVRIEEKRKQDFTLVFYQTSVEKKGVDFIREIKNHVYDKRQMSGWSSFPQGRGGRSGVHLGIFLMGVFRLVLQILT